MLMPIAAACCGMMLCALMPGIVFTSMKYGSPSRTMKSMRTTPRQFSFL